MIVAMFDELSEAVGQGQPNRKVDVELVQRWLQTWDKYFWPGSPGFSEGHLDGFTQMAIERFQRETMGQRMPSGVVEPGDATATKMASTPGPRPEGRILSLPIRTNFDPVSEKDYEEAAKKLKCEVRIIKAVAKTESRGEAFDRKQRPTILFEPDKFHKFTQHKWASSHPNIKLDKTTVNNKVIFHYGTHSKQWAELEEAYSLDSKAAIEATSWGRFQIMGFNFYKAGFSLLEHFLVAMCASEKDQLLAFMAFVKYDPKQLKALQTKQWTDFAKMYNGSNYKQNNYDVVLRDHYDKQDW